MACGQVTTLNSQTLCHAARADGLAAQVVDFKGVTGVRQRVFEGISTLSFHFCFIFETIKSAR
jgi:hypothetical protein